MQFSPEEAGLLKAAASWLGAGLSQTSLKRKKSKLLWRKKVQKEKTGRYHASSRMSLTNWQPEHVHVLTDSPGPSALSPGADKIDRMSASRQVRPTNISWLQDK